MNHSSINNKERIKQTSSNKGNDDVFQKLIDLGFKKGLASEYIEQYGPDHINEKITEVEKMKRVKNKGAYLHDMLKNGYSAASESEDDQWFKVKSNGKITKVWRDSSGAPMKTKEKYYFGKCSGRMS